MFECGYSDQLDQIMTISNTLSQEHSKDHNSPSIIDNTTNNSIEDKITSHYFQDS